MIEETHSNLQAEGARERQSSKDRAKKNEVIWGGHSHVRAQKQAIAPDVIVCCSGSGKALLGNTLNPCSYPHSSLALLPLLLPLLFHPCCSALVRSLLQLLWMQYRHAC